MSEDVSAEHQHEKDQGERLPRPLRAELNIVRRRRPALRHVVAPTRAGGEGSDHPGEVATLAVAVLRGNSD